MRKAILFFMLLTSLCARAQEEAVNPRFRIPKVVVKWSPFHLLNHYPTFQVALEQRVSDKFSIQYDFGSIFFLNKLRDESSESFHQRGFKAKLELRHYILPHNKYWRIYYGPEIYFNRVNYKKRKSFGMDCVDGQCDYYRAYTYDMHYREPGLNLKTGALFHVYRLCIDFQIGMAVRFISYQERNKPAGEERLEEDDSGLFMFDFSPKEESRTEYFSPTACIRIGYTIK